MKVLFLSQIVPYPPHGGVLQRGYNLVRELGKHAEVHLLAFLHPDELRTPEAIEQSKIELGRFCKTVEYFPLWAKSSPLHRAAALALGIGSSKPFSVVAHRSAPFAKRTRQLLESGSMDLLHVDTVALSEFVHSWNMVPTVLTHHNIESTLMARRASVETRSVAKGVLRRESRKLVGYEAAMAPRFDVNIMMSSPDEMALHNAVPNVRTAVVPNGVDTGYFVPAPEQETPALIYAGGMNMFANRDAVMFFVSEIWPRITAAVPDVKFFAIGQDPPQELRAIAERDPRVIAPGFVKDVRPFVSQAAIYVVPLRVGGGTRLKVLDAMASGKAIVSTSIGCEGIDVTAGEHMLVEDTPEGFAKATVALLGNAVRRRELGTAARAQVERRYAWPVVGEMLMDAYGQAINHFAANGGRQ